jgi:hypothetical protein
VWPSAPLPLIRNVLSVRCLLAMTRLFACSHKEIDGTNRQGWSGRAVVGTYSSTFGAQNDAVIFPNGTAYATGTGSTGTVPGMQTPRSRITLTRPSSPAVLRVPDLSTGTP